MNNKPRFAAYLIPIFFTLAVPAMAWAFGPYSADYIRTIDGDTVVLDVRLWPGLRKTVSVRLLGVDAPESRRGYKNKVRITDCEIAAGKRAAEFVREFMGQGPVTVSDIQPDKYAGRVDGNIFVNGKDLSQALLNAGLAVSYDGGERSAWGC